MLTTLTRKLCPLLSLAIITIGCGKKITQDQSLPIRSRENQEIPSAYLIEIDGSQTSRKNYFLSYNAQFRIPDRLLVKQGNTNGKVVEIAYDVNQFDNDDYFFKCIYVASPNPAEMNLNKCVDYDDDDFGDVSNNTFTLYKNDIIQMRFTGAPSSDLVIEAIYSMTWMYPKN